DSAIAKSSAPGFLDVRTIVRSTGAIAAGAGVLYATNRCPRAAAVTLLATTSVGWAGRKKGWELRGEELTQELRSILTEAGRLGGGLRVVVDTEGRPSLGYRANRLVERGQRRAAAKQREIEKRAGALEKKAKGAVSTAQKQLAEQRG